jgi:hypothetical protein
MSHKLRFTPTADEKLTNIENDRALKGLLKQVRKTLGYLETDLRANSLQTHEFESLTRRYGQKVFEAYVQQNTPAAYRIFWRHGPDETDRTGKRIAVITIIAITQHPNHILPARNSI